MGELSDGNYTKTEERRKRKREGPERGGGEEPEYEGMSEWGVGSWRWWRIWKGKEPLKASEEKVLQETVSRKMDTISTRTYIETLLYIRTKAKELIPLVLNAPQRRLFAEIERLRALGKAIRILVLKARQEGVSTLIEALIFEATARHENVSSLIVAHDLDSSNHLFGMSSLFYEKLPDYLKPPPKYSNRKELIFADPLRSSIEVDTAENQRAGRSYTPQNFHGSEVAFWPHAKEVMLGVSQAVPNLPGTMIVLESTANGAGGWFYREWQRAKRGETDYIPFFIPWFEMDDYSTKVSEGKIGHLDDEEKRLVELYDLSDEQIAWRRWAIPNLCSGDIDTFRQEYPADPQEAFRFSGRCKFPVAVVTEYLDHAPDPADIGNLEEEETETETEIVFHPEASGFLKVWKHPVENMEYVIGADVAEGLAPENEEQKQGDYSCAVVLDRQTFEQVAEWHGHIDADLFGRELSVLGRYYNDALLGVEVNNHGLTTLTALKNLGYWNIFKREILDQATKKVTLRVGWQTSTKTKPVMIDNFVRAVRERKLGMNSEALIGECLTYMIAADGTTNAQSGSYDDRVVAMAIAVQMYSRAYAYEKRAEKPYRGQIETKMDAYYEKIYNPPKPRRGRRN